MWRFDYTTEETPYIGQFMKSIEACLANVLPTNAVLQSN